MKNLNLLLLIILFFTLNMNAGKRIHIADNQLFYDAEAIVRANAEVKVEQGKYSQKKYHVTITITEVLKGDCEKNEVVSVVRENRMTSGHGPDRTLITESAQDMILLFTKDWREKKYPILRAYKKGSSAEAVYSMFKIPENERILKYQEAVVAKSNDAFNRLFAEYKHMRDPNNFPLVLKFIEKNIGLLQERERKQLLDFIGSTNDLRAVPLLLKFLNKEITFPKVKFFYNSAEYIAAVNLKLIFPGAPKVDEALMAEYEDKNLNRILKDYPLKMDPKSSVPHWDKVGKMIEQGKVSEAKKALLDKSKASTNLYGYYKPIERLIPLCTEAEITNLLPEILDRMEKDFENIKEYDRYYLMEVCKVLNNPACIPILKKLLVKPSGSRYLGSQVTAAMNDAVYEFRSFGEESKAEGFKHLFDSIDTSKRDYLSSMHRDQALLRLIWLSSEKDYVALEEKFHKKWRSSWKEFSPLIKIINSSNPGPQLVEWLANLKSYSPDLRFWVIRYLGEIKESSAVDLIIDHITQESYSIRGKDELVGALINIGGQKVVDNMEALMTNKDVYNIRSIATKVLLQSEEVSSHDLALKIISSKDYGFKREAFAYLQKYGSHKDIEIIKPHCDFWSCDRKFMREAQQALTSLRRKYFYDINGPRK